MYRKIFFPLVLIAFLMAACAPTMQPTMILPDAAQVTSTPVIPEMTPFPTRPAYGPGELVDYTAQSGDTLPALAVRFNTTVDEIRRANPIIPGDATTMPPGMPMQVPIYYRPLWGNPFQILPDAPFVNGPAASGFNTALFINVQPGWLQHYSTWAFSGTRTAAEVVDYVAVQYSISPKVLIALLEYQGGACSHGVLDESAERNILGLESSYWTGVYLQLSYAANILNDGYYRWRDGELVEFELSDGSLVRPDPWQNAATVSLQYFFSQVLNPLEFQYAIGPDGFSKVYQSLFEDPWTTDPHIPGSLVQPEMKLPYNNDIGWAFTGGPHTAWGSMSPWAALDFAPPAEVTGCYPTSVPTTAVADGVVARDGDGILVLDLDGDGNERTGWVVFYLHIAKDGRIPVGTVVKAGDPLGYPSCEGGRSTGTHIHIARKYNGEWLTADGVIPFVLSGWRPVRGEAAYKGWMVKDDVMVVANTNPDNRSTIPLDLQ
jgi:murein DD-endopeptidase MepM/ murein hydrolase activator NlpD